MTEQEKTMVVEAMTAIPFFPSEPAARSLIGSELQRMCGTLDRAMWLARRLTQLYSKWPGLMEVRAVLSSKWTPNDGIEAWSQVYIDGIPSEREERPQIAARQVLELPAGHEVSADPELEKLVVETAKEKALPPLPKYYARTADERRVDEELRAMFRLPAKEEQIK